MEENSNVVGIRPMPNSYRLPDGVSILTGALDPVLYAAFLEQKKTLEDVTAKYGAVEVLAKRLSLEKEAAQMLARRWRWCAYLGICSIWLTLFTPQIVRAFLH